MNRIMAYGYEHPERWGFPLDWYSDVGYAYSEIRLKIACEALTTIIKELICRRLRDLRNRQLWPVPYHPRRGNLEKRLAA